MAPRTAPPFRADLSGSGYAVQDEFRADLAAAYADEITALAALGCSYLQFDDTCSRSCGFASTVYGNALTLDQKRAKLDLIVETAADLWGT